MSQRFFQASMRRDLRQSRVQSVARQGDWSANYETGLKNET